LNVWRLENNINEFDKKEINWTKCITGCMKSLKELLDWQGKNAFLENPSS